jgi:hypothetical protein
VWLHRAARYAASNARRMLTRQANRERRAARPEAQMNPCTTREAEEYRALLPVLDEAIDRLPERDRSGVVMCFFQRRTYGQIGAVLGITEEAARKRVSRALDRMREHFAHRGVLASSAALCAALTSESAVAAPATLAGATANLATLSQLAAGAGGGGAVSSTTTIMNGVIHTMMMAKVKLAAAACAAIAFGGAVTGAAIHQIGAPPSSATFLASTTLALEGAPFAAKASDRIEAEFLGINKWGAGGKGWWAIDGAKIDDPRGPFTNENLRARPDVTHQAVLHVSGNDLNGGYGVTVPQATSTQLYDLTPSQDEAFLLIPIAAPKDVKTVDIELRVADGEWTTIVTAEHVPNRPLGDHETEYGGVVFTHVDEAEGGGSCVYVAHNIVGPQFDVVATDAQGNEHRAFNINGGPVGNFTAVRFDYNIPPDQIAGMAVKVRPFNKKVTAKNVTLDPATPTKPQIVVEDVPEKK